MPTSPEGRCTVEFLDLVAELLLGVDSPGACRELLAGFCERFGQVTKMLRVAMFVADGPGQHSAAATFGLSDDVVIDVEPSQEEVRLLQVAALENRVVMAGATSELEVPTRYTETLGVTTLACAPLFAADRCVGVMLADRGGTPFELSDEEIRLVWLAAKVTALAVSARMAAAFEERTLRLAERIALERRIHENVVQRLAGVSLVLGAERHLASSQRERCRGEVSTALVELRESLESPIRHDQIGGTSSLRRKLAQLSCGTYCFAVEVNWAQDVEVPVGFERLVDHFLSEALANVRKHARPTRLEITVARTEIGWCVDVVNDGVTPGAGGAGMGQRLLSAEALMHGGHVEFGAQRGNSWRASLVLPVVMEAVA